MSVRIVVPGVRFELLKRVARRSGVCIALPVYDLYNAYLLLSCVDCA